MTEPTFDSKMGLDSAECVIGPDRLLQLVDEDLEKFRGQKLRLLFLHFATQMIHRIVTVLVDS